LVQDCDRFFYFFIYVTGYEKEETNFALDYDRFFILFLIFVYM
jgi:hypothetical protein